MNNSTLALNFFYYQAVQQYFNHSSMRERNRNSEMFHGNIIKLTQTGQNILQSLDQDALSSNPSQKFLKTQCNLPSKDILPFIMKLKKPVTESSHTYKNIISKKVKKAHITWVQNQKQINLKLKRAIKKREIESSQVYQWEKATSYYKENINTIIDEWNGYQKEEKKRIKERVQGIYIKKYKSSLKKKAIKKEASLNFTE